MWPYSSEQESPWALVGVQRPLPRPPAARSWPWPSAAGVVDLDLGVRLLVILVSEKGVLRLQPTTWRNTGAASRNTVNPCSKQHDVEASLGETGGGAQGHVDTSREPTAQPPPGTGRPRVRVRLGPRGPLWTPGVALAEGSQLPWKTLVCTYVHLPWTRSDSGGVWKPPVVMTLRAWRPTLRPETRRPGVPCSSRPLFQVRLSLLSVLASLETVFPCFYPE